MPRGRKRPDLSEGVLSTITTAVMLGLSDSAIIALLRSQHDLVISRSTWKNWQKQHPQVRDAGLDGMAKSEHAAARVLWTAMTQERDMNLAFKAARHWEKSRHGRSDVAETRIDVTSSDGSAVGVQIYIPDNGRDGMPTVVAPRIEEDDD